MPRACFGGTNGCARLIADLSVEFGAACLRVQHYRNEKQTTEKTERTEDGLSQIAVEFLRVLRLLCGLFLSAHTYLLGRNGIELRKKRDT